MTFSLVVKKKSPTRELHYSSRELFGGNPSSIAQGGPLGMTVIVPPGLHHEEPRVFDDVILYNAALEPIWDGRIHETPAVSAGAQMRALVCEGHQNALTDIDVGRLFSDTGYEGWSLTPPTAPTDSWQWESLERDTNDRLFFRVPRGLLTNTNLASGIYYRKCHTDAINQDIFSITFTYETLAGYDSAKT